MTNPHHLTLTTHARPYLTRAHLREVADIFRSLRRKVLFSRAVAGGFVNFEVDRGPAGWVVCAHIVMDLRLPLTENTIKKSWHSLGGGQQIKLDEIVPGTQSNVFFYGAKRPNLPLDPDLVRQYLNATHRFQMSRSFGSVHRLRGRRPSWAKFCGVQPEPVSISTPLVVRGAVR